MSFLSLKVWLPCKLGLVTSKDNWGQLVAHILTRSSQEAAADESPWIWAKSALYSKLIREIQWDPLSKNLLYIYVHRYEVHRYEGKQVCILCGKNRDVKCFFSMFVSVQDKTNLLSITVSQESVRVSTFTLSYSLVSVCLCMCVYTWVQLPAEPRRGSWTLWSWSYTELWAIQLRQ